MENPQGVETQRNHYLVLGVPPNAERDTIKTAFRELVKTHHPDRNPNNRDVAARRMREITAAYSVVSDPTARKEYDTQPIFRLRIPKGMQTAARAKAPEPKQSFLAKFFNLKPKDGPGSDYNAYFSAAVSCAQYPGGKLLGQAEIEFKRTLRIRPDAWDARYNLGLICYLQGKYDEAFVRFQEVSKNNPEDAASRRLMEMLTPFNASSVRSEQ